MMFAGWGFTLAGSYGLAVMTLMLVVEPARIPAGKPLGHPELDADLAGITWIFLAIFRGIGRDRSRRRPPMSLQRLET